MTELDLEIVNRLGLHARAAAKFVTLAGRFESTVDLVIGDQKVNGKSIMAVMMLAARQGMQLTMRIDGPDEVEAAESLAALIADRFGEAE